MMTLENIHRAYNQACNTTIPLEVFKKSEILRDVLVSKIPNEIKPYVDVANVQHITDSINRWYNLKYKYNDFILEYGLRKAVVAIHSDISSESPVKAPPHVYKYAETALKLLVDHDA